MEIIKKKISELPIATSSDELFAFGIRINSDNTKESVQIPPSFWGGGTYVRFDELSPEQINQLRGAGITSIELTSINGKAKTYTITYADNLTKTFTVTDGNDGEDGHTPVISFVGTTIYVDGVTQVDLKGEKGDAFTYGDFTQEQIDGFKQPAIQVASQADVVMSNLTAQVNSKMTEVDERIENIGELSPFVISSKEEVIGEYLLNGEKATIYEKTVELNDLPTTVGATKNYVIATEPLGYGLYFKVESFVASTGKGLASQFFNSNYKVVGYQIDEAFSSAITIECVEDVSEIVNGILHVRYCKFEGEMVEMTINLSSSDPIDVNNFVIPPLKYNKKFAVSMSTDDAGSDDWAKVFQYFNGGFINNMTEGAKSWHAGMLFPDGGWLSRALTYTDGCGVQRRFPVQSASVFNVKTIYWFGPVKDIPETELTRSGSNYPYLYWQDIEEILDFDGAVSLHDVQDPAVDNYAGGTIQEIINGINDAQDNFIYPRLGRKLLVMTEPNGDYRYVDASLQIPEIKLITRQQSEGGFGVINANNIDLSTKVKLIRHFSDGGTLESHKTKFLTDIITPSLTNGQRMYGDFGMHGFGQTGGSYTFETLPTMNKPMFFDWLCDTYGEHGSDELWFCTQDEFICYQMTKSLTSIKAEQTGDKVHLKVFLPKIPNVYWNEISVLYDGGEIPLNSIEAPNEATTLSYSNTSEGFMINMSTNERLLENAEKYTSIFEQEYDSENVGLSQYALRNANYFIQRLNPSLQAPFRNRVDSLIAEPTLSSISINNGDTATQSQTVFISPVYSAGIPTHYRVGGTSDLSSADWIAFQSGGIPFTLSAQYGVKTVYFQLMNAFGVSSVVSDSIELTEASLELTSISLNGGNQSTNSPSISILFGLIGSATHYMLSENSAFTGALWVTMENPVTFNLSTATYGNKTIYAKLKNDNTGVTSITRNATIELIDTVSVTLDSIQINGGVEYTGARGITIIPTFSNIATHYRIGESSDLSMQTWVEYSSGSISYNLSETFGAKTVYLQLKNSNGESVVKNSQIQYVQTVTLNSILLANGDVSFEGTNVPVSLTISGGTPTHYRAGEISDLSAIAWIEYTGNFNYNFNSVGSKTLYAQVKNQIGDSLVQSDSIALTEASLTVLVGYWAYTGGSNNKCTPVEVQGKTYNHVNPSSHATYGSHSLFDSNGDLTDIKIHLHASYYPIRENPPFPVGNASIGDVASFHPTLSGDTGFYPDIVISKVRHPNDLSAGRICFNLPAGQYRFRSIMSVSSGAVINDSMRPNVFYRIYDPQYNLLAENTVPEGFTGLNNVDFNSEMVFTVEETSDIIYALMPHATGRYRPGVNLLEITKLS